MNPVVIIATHKRLDITKRNIESLLNQSVKPQIVVVSSLPEEAIEYGEINKGVFSRQIPNEPLSAKWQWAVTFSRALNPDPLIITGSDDILGQDFVKNACNMVKDGINFIGLMRWWQHYKGRAYLCDYLPQQPLGGGRVYSNKMLEDIEWRLFSHNAKKHLDDFGWNAARKSGLKCYLSYNTEHDNLHIHAIKGDWSMLNKFTIHHKNVRLLRSEPSERILPELFRKPVTETSNSFSECVG